MRAILAAAMVLAAACSETRGASPEQETGAPPIAYAERRLGLHLVSSELVNPVYLTSPVGDGRLFVVEQAGRIRIIRDGKLLPDPFLDITEKVRSGGEQGLLSVAIHPKHRENGYVYVNYTDKRGDTQIERYRASANRDRAESTSAKKILSIDQPYGNHNGGLNMFGPDGMLYIGTGDGGSGGDPHGNGQSTRTLLGKLLRIDVDRGTPYAIPGDNPFARGGGRAEIWATGLRNPWRFAFDRANGALYIADVGQNAYEEVDVVPANRPGVNYGWNIREGAACFRAAKCERTGLQQPVVSYGRSGGECTVIGGFTYRGKAVPALTGHYFYADYCAGWIRSFRWQGGRAADHTKWGTPAHGMITSFGEDSAGELYVIAHDGSVFRIVGA